MKMKMKMITSDYEEREGDNLIEAYVWHMWTKNNNLLK